MAKFAIVRADGSVDVAEGMSVQDVADHYGWPGNGTIEPLGAEHTSKIANTFDTPADQRAAWEKVARKEKQPGFDKPETTTGGNS
jgi:hypothetical protein